MYSLELLWPWLSLRTDRFGFWCRAQRRATFHPGVEALERRLALATIFVSPGNNTQIQAVIDGLNPGDELVFRAGNYEGAAFDLADNGLQNAFITIRGENRDTVRIQNTGSEPAFDTRGHDFIRIKDFSFENVRMGVQVRSGSNNIEIDGLNIVRSDFGVYLGQRPGAGQDVARAISKVTVRNVVATSNRTRGSTTSPGTGDGIRVDRADQGDVSDLTFENIVVSGFAYVSNAAGFINGDGFIIEDFVRDVKIRDVVAFGNGDSGFDIKGNQVTLERITAHDNGNQNLKNWGTGNTVFDSLLHSPGDKAINVRTGNIRFVNSTIVDGRIELDSESGPPGQLTLDNSIVARWSGPDPYFITLPNGPVPVLNQTLKFDATEPNPGPDPLFVSRLAKDFHLQSNSPAIDAGDRNRRGAPAPTIDRDGLPRIFGPEVDQGAFEFQVNGQVQLTLVSSPAGVPLKFDSQTVGGPINSQPGTQHSIEAPPTATIGGVQYVFASWSDGGAATHTITTPASNTTYTATYNRVVDPPLIRQDPGPDGLVVMEAEGNHANVSQGGKSWTSYTGTQGFSGASALQATPNTGVRNIGENYLTNSPRLDFNIEFVKTGIHYVWVRGLGLTFEDDSVHVGLNGIRTQSSENIDGFTTNWRWTQDILQSDAVAVINIPSLGVHTLNLWMREDGTIVDTLLLTTNPNFNPNNPIISISGTPQVLEGNAGTTTTATFTVSLSNPTDADVVSVRVDTANGSAVTGDYNAITNQILTFNPGSPLSQQVLVTINGDGLDENDETFTVNLSTPMNGGLGGTTATGTILDDDPVNGTTGVTASLVGTQLQIFGGPGAANDVILVDQIGGPTGSIRVFDNGTQVANSPFSATSVTTIFVDAKAGDDTVTIDSTTNPVQASKPATIFGFAGNDTLNGGLGNDFIDGIDGDDTQNGFGGDDQLIGTNPVGTSGTDKLMGGSGNDLLFADLPDITAATPVVLGGDGPGIGAASGVGDDLTIDTSTGVTFDNNMAPGLATGIGGFEIIRAGSGNDTITVTNATVNDGVFVIGGGGDDFLIGGPAPDALQGGAGNDRMVGLASADTFVGDTGFDTVDYSVSPAPAAPIPGFAGINGVVADLRAAGGSLGSHGGHSQGDLYLANDCESVIGTQNDDYIIGNLLNNVLDGLAGNDTIVGNQGNDELIGGLGDDTLIGSDGAVFTDVDKLDGGAGNDTVYADAADLTGAPAKVLGGSGGFDVLDFIFSSGVNFINDFSAGAATGGFELILGSSGNDTISTAGPGTLPGVHYAGLGGNDTLTGGNGNDILDGGDGNDTLISGLGADFLLGGAGTDSAPDFNAGQGDTQTGIP
jgi:hypothetical protein